MHDEELLDLTTDDMLDQARQLMIEADQATGKRAQRLQAQAAKVWWLLDTCVSHGDKLPSEWTR